MFKLSLLIGILIFWLHYVKCKESHAVYARIESCPGCQLNRLPEVKQFVYDDVPKYNKVDFKKIPGAPPELVLLDENYGEIQRIPLQQLTRQACNDLLISNGFELIKTHEL